MVKMTRKSPLGGVVSTQRWTGTKTLGVSESCPTTTSLDSLCGIIHAATGQEIQQQAATYSPRQVQKI